MVTGGVVFDASHEHPGVPPHVVASGLAVVAGSVVMALGLLRCGWIVNLIPLVALSAFTTGSALTIASTQLPALLGITGVSTRNAPYQVWIDTLRGLPAARGLDAAVGVSALALLYSVRFASGVVAKRWPRRQRLAFFVSTLRSVVVIVLYTLISWLVNMSHPRDPSFSILLTVPRGPSPSTSAFRCSTSVPTYQVPRHADSDLTCSQDSKPRACP